MVFTVAKLRRATYGETLVSGLLRRGRGQERGARLLPVEADRLTDLTELETRLVLERFCDKKGMGPCGVFYPEDQQKQHLPDLDAKVRGWVERNLGRFRPTEIIGMYRFLAQKRQAIE